MKISSAHTSKQASSSHQQKPRLLGGSIYITRVAPFTLNEAAKDKFFLNPG